MQGEHRVQRLERARIAVESERWTRALELALDGWRECRSTMLA